MAVNLKSLLERLANIDMENALKTSSMQNAFVTTATNFKRAQDITAALRGGGGAKASGGTGSMAEASAVAREVGGKVAASVKQALGAYSAGGAAVRAFTGRAATTQSVSSGGKSAVQPMAAGGAAGAAGGAGGRGGGGAGGGTAATGGQKPAPFFQQSTIAQWKGAFQQLFSGHVLDGIGKMALLLPKTTMALQKFAEETLEGSRELARYSPQIANVFARLDRQQLQLDVRQAQATSGTAGFLGNQTMKLKSETAWIGQATSNVVNEIAGVGALFGRGLNKLLGPVQFIATKIGLADDPGKAPAPISNAYTQLLDHVLQGNLHGGKAPKNKKPGEK